MSIMAIDVAKIRAGTPGVDRVLHLNHAGGSLVPQAVQDAIVDHLQRELEIGAMEAGYAAAAALEQVRIDAATLLGADADEIAFTSSNSESWGRAFAGLHLKPGDRVLVGRAEWSSNLANMQKAGLEIESVPVDEHGRLSVEALGRMLDGRVRLVSLTWAPANGGLIEPAVEVGRLARAAGVPYFLDATQAVGQMPVDVRELGCDVLTTNARKYLRGPRGAALLFVRRDFGDRLDPSFVDNFSASIGPAGVLTLRGDARRMETGDCSVAGRLGLGVAIRLALNLGLDEIREAVRHRAEHLRDRLATVSGVQLHDLGVDRSGLVSFTYDGWSGTKLRDALAPHAVNISFNGRSYTPLDMAARGLDEILRASVSYFTTEEEVERFVAILAETKI
jgi:selenocysteine lyase/cysteine desulfurase